LGACGRNSVWGRGVCRAEGRVTDDDELGFWIFYLLGWKEIQRFDLGVMMVFQLLLQSCVKDLRLVVWSMSFSGNRTGAREEEE
jgi:hypothetical protein